MLGMWFVIVHSRVHASLTLTVHMIATHAQRSTKWSARWRHLCVMHGTSLLNILRAFEMQL